MNEVILTDLLNQIRKEKGLRELEEESELYNYFQRCSREVWRSEPDKHRHYSVYDTVRAISHNGVDYFFEDTDWTIYSEAASAKDCDLYNPSTDCMVQVYPKEVTTVVYAPKEVKQ